jgi:hypothetical protein
MKDVNVPMLEELFNLMAPTKAEAQEGDTPIQEMLYENTSLTLNKFRVQEILHSNY